MVWSVLEWRVETGPELPRSPASAWSLVGFPSPSCLASAPPRAALVSPTTARGHHRQVPCPFPPLCLLRLTTLMPRLMRKEDQRKHAPICTVGAFARKMQPVPLTSFLLWFRKTGLLWLPKCLLQDYGFQKAKCRRPTNVSMEEDILNVLVTCHERASQKKKERKTRQERDL